MAELIIIAILAFIIFIVCKYGDRTIDIDMSSSGDFLDGSDD
ncbi:MAG: hypothetical protein O2970_10370 [Proteobacteria bacterium]|nr:hypothetical protein [Pseudomonadota bacterium]MDA0967346.1 hypothetical protein [Pseudomonadota bacterium]